MGPTQADAQSWAGFVESRLRKLVSDLLGRSLPIKKIQLWPKKKEACIADKSALLTQAQRQNCITYFIGFQVDKKRVRGGLNLEIPLQNFRDWDLSRFPVLAPGMDLLVKHFKVNELPRICFEGMYENGKDEAMKKRRQLRDADPARQEKKRLARLEELKAKMEEIQRKKEAEMDKKRKREEIALEEDVIKQVNEEELSGTQTLKSEGDGDNDEADLLFNALETVQEPGEGMTREEAEAEKEKLLSGELVEAEPDVDGYESDENAVGYAKDEARQVFVHRKSIAENKWKDKRSLPVNDEVIEELRTLGYNVVSDEEATMLGANMIPPWRSEANDSESHQQQRRRPPIRSLRIKFAEKFDIVELDAIGHVIDKGDDDFFPSKTWIGRKPAMEFKLGGMCLRTHVCLFNYTF